jgi:hypothetical protein
MCIELNLDFSWADPWLEPFQMCAFSVTQLRIQAKLVFGPSWPYDDSGSNRRPLPCHSRQQSELIEKMGTDGGGRSLKASEDI